MTVALGDRLAVPPILVAPGIFDALGALLAEQAGFDCLYLSGASVAYTQLGRPDVGLVSSTEVARVIDAVRDRTELPLVVDADTGFGNALNVGRTVRLFERAGASAIQIEDQTTPKRCGHLAGKTLVTAAQMEGKIKAALDARRDDMTLIVARTDAIAVEGFEAALERAACYREAGADVLFVEAPRTRDELAAVPQRLPAMPLVANMVEGGGTPPASAAQLDALGYRLAIFPGGLVRAVARAAQDYLAALREHGTTGPFRDHMLDLAGINAVVGTADLLELGSRYEPDPEA
jgi:2-methylisocitrate lyase-like PEP mutase family enzyme